MPAILTESGFMDNLTEAVDMLDPTFQKADAEGTCKGICKTFGVKYIPPENEKKEEKDDNKNNESNEINTDVKYIKVITKELNIRSAASWDDDVISGTVKKIKVDSYYMYKLKSGVYITASTKYVEVFER